MIDDLDIMSGKEKGLNGFACVSLWKFAMSEKGHGNMIQLLLESI